MSVARLSRRVPLPQFHPAQSPGSRPFMDVESHFHTRSRCWLPRGFAATGLGIPEFVGTASLRHLTLSPVCSLPSVRSCSNGVGGAEARKALPSLKRRVSSTAERAYRPGKSGSPLNPATFEDLQDTPKRTGSPDFFVSCLHDSDPVGISTNRGLDFTRSAVFRCSRRSLCN
jgi:hypothetical protein